MMTEDQDSTTEPFTIVPSISDPIPSAPPEPEKSVSTSAGVPPPSALPSFLTSAPGGTPPQAGPPPSVAPPGAGPPPPMLPSPPATTQATSSAPPPPSSSPNTNPFSITSKPPNSSSAHPKPPTMPPVPVASVAPPVLPPMPPTVGQVNQPPASQQQQQQQPPVAPPTQTGVDLDSIMQSFGIDQAPPDPSALEGTPDGSWSGWIKSTVSGNPLLSQLAEKAKTGVNTMVTTLDPQMKEYMFAEGTIDLAVASDKQPKISGVKDGFQREFTTVKAQGLGCPGMHSSQQIAAQPVGFENGKKGAELRISSLRDSGLVTDETPVVGIENFVVEIYNGCWQDMGCLILDDRQRGISVCAFTQPTSVPTFVIENMKSHTPADYPMRSSGLAVTVGASMAECSHDVMVQQMSDEQGMTPANWHQLMTGHSRQQLIATASQHLARLYKIELLKKYQQPT